MPLLVDLETLLLESNQSNSSSSTTTTLYSNLPKSSSRLMIRAVDWNSTRPGDLMKSRVFLDT